MALHNERAAFGVTHGRSYKKDKMTSLDEDTWNLTKLLFDNTKYPYQGADPGGVLLATNRAYLPPEAVRRIGRSPLTFVDRERMGVAVPEMGPVTANPQAPYGLSYTDPAYVDLWWGMNAFTAWPVVPLTMQTYGLWTNPQLAQLAGYQAFVDDPATAQAISAQGAAIGDLYLLNEVNTYTWRSPDEPAAALRLHHLPAVHPRVLPAGPLRRGDPARPLDVRSPRRGIRRALLVPAGV